MKTISLPLFLLVIFGLSAQAKVYDISREQVLESLTRYRATLTEFMQQVALEAKRPLTRAASLGGGMEASENDAKSDLLNQIILETDIHFQGGDYRKFLITTTAQLIEINSKSENRLGIDLRDYLTQLRDSLQDDMEPTENPALFLVQFLSSNSIMNPQLDSSMDAIHAYSNGKEWQYTQGHKFEETGHWAAQQSPTSTSDPDEGSDFKHSEQLDGITREILSNSISTRAADSSNSSPGIIQFDGTDSPYDWILQNSINPY